MKTTKWVLLIGIVALTLFVDNLWAAGGRGRRIENPNAIDNIPSPFTGVVVSATASSVTVKGTVQRPKKTGVIPNPNESQSHERSVNFSLQMRRR